MADGRLKYTTEIDNSQLQRDAQRSKDILHGIGQTAEQEGAKIDNSFKKIGASIAAALTIQQLTSFAQQVIKVRGEIQSLEVSFTTLLGSKEKAAALFSELRSFAVKTPLMLNDLSKAAQMLLSFNVDAEKVMPTLRAIGDISMGDAQKLQSLTLAFAQMSSTGKLMGQDLLQMINAGFNPLTVISEKTGKSIADLKDEMSKGAISADLVAQAFMSAASAGGKFYGMLDSQSQTIQGSISNLEGAWDDMLNAIGEDTEGIINGTVQALADLVKNYEAVGKVIAELIATYGIYKAALITFNTIQALSIDLTKGYTIAQTLQIKALMAAEKAQKLLNATILKNPYALAAAAVAALAYGIYKLATAETEAERELKEVNARLAEQEKELKAVKQQDDIMVDMQKKVVASTTEETIKIKKLNDIIHNNEVSLQGRKKAIADLQSIIPNYHAELDTEGKLHRENTKAVDDYINSLNRLAMAEAIKSKTQEASQGILEATMAIDTSVIDRTGAVANIGQRERELAAAKKRAAAGTQSFSTSAGIYYATPSTDAEETALQLSKARLQEIDNNIEINKRKIKEYEKQLQQLSEIAKQYQPELDRLNSGGSGWATGSGTGTDKKKEKEAARIADQIAERTEKIKEYEAALATETRKAELEIAQARIDAMDEGMAKTSAQIEQNYRRLTEENRQREEEMLAKLKDTYTNKWMNENPTARDAEIYKYRAGLNLTRENLPSSEQRILQMYEEQAEKYLVEANKDALDKMLENLRTYEQQREAIEQEYDKRIADLYVEGNAAKGFRKGVTDGNLTQLLKSRKQAMSALETQAIKESEEYAKLIAGNMNLADKEVQDLANTLRTDLQRRLKDNLITAEDYLELWEQINGAVEKASTPKSGLLSFLNGGGTGSIIDKFKEKGDSLFSDGLKQYETASQAYETAMQTFNTANANAAQGQQKAAQGMMNAGSMMSGAAGKAAGAVGLIDAIINGINDTVQGLNGAFELMKEMAESMGADTGPNSSWGNFTSYFNVFAESSQYATDAWNSLKEGNIGGVIKGVVGSITSIFTNFAKINDAKLQEEIDNDARAIKRLNWELEDLSDLVDEVYGKTKQGDIELQIANIKKQIALVQDQLRLEQDKKDTDDDQVEEYKRQIQELENQLKDYQKAAQDAIFGDDIQAQIEGFTDAVTNAWAESTGAAKSAKDYVNDIMKRMVTESINDYIQASGAMQKIRDSLESAFLDEILSEEEKARIFSMAEDLQAEIDKRYGWAEDMFEEETERTASSKGIASASQESVDELNGRMTAVQGHTYSISENTKLLLANTSAILESVLRIETNTDRLEAVENGIKDVKTTINNIALHGIKVK